jgi:hypothetical protein
MFKWNSFIVVDNHWFKFGLITGDEAGQGQGASMRFDQRFDIWGQNCHSSNDIWQQSSVFTFSQTYTGMSIGFT